MQERGYLQGSLQHLLGRKLGTVYSSLAAPYRAARSLRQKKAKDLAPSVACRDPKKGKGHGVRPKSKVGAGPTPPPHYAAQVSHWRPWLLLASVVSAWGTGSGQQAAVQFLQCCPGSLFKGRRAGVNLEAGQLQQSVIQRRSGEVAATYWQVLRACRHAQQSRGVKNPDVMSLAALQHFSRFPSIPVEALADLDAVLDWSAAKPAGQRTLSAVLAAEVCPALLQLSPAPVCAASVTSAPSVVHAAPVTRACTCA